MNQSDAFPLRMVHKHWKQLNLDSISEEDSRVKEENVPICDIQWELDGLIKKYNNTSDIQKNELKRKLRAFGSYNKPNFRTSNAVTFEKPTKR